MSAPVDGRADDTSLRGIESVTARDILARTRELIPTPTQWTQRAMARDAGGASVDPTSPLAVCWCLYGAWLRATDGESTEDADRAVSALARGCERIGSGGSISWFNDRRHRTHAQVLQAIDAAIESLKGRQ